jgi:hypothetical protein
MLQMEVAFVILVACINRSVLLLLLLLQALHELAGGELAGATGGRGGPSSLQQETLDFVQQQSMVVSFSCQLS